MAVAAVAAGLMLKMSSASAVPSFARQTGQPCSTCHTAFPELTPFGRQFKLMGYTSGGTRCNDGSAKSDEEQVPLAVMSQPIYTHVKNPGASANGNSDNDKTEIYQTSLFVAGQVYCNVGALAQITYNNDSHVAFWDQSDIRYAKSVKLDGTNIIFGVTVNNTPTAQDVWNTAPAWSFPYITSPFGPQPSVSTMIESAWAQRVGGAGAYLWINNMLYLEFTAYGAYDPRTLTTFGQNPSGNRFDGAAPYWRAAIEKTWDKNSLMFGTFGMYANVQPVGANPGNTSALSYPAGVFDPTLDIGVDSQYQFIGETDIFTVRASYIWERAKLNGEYFYGAPDSSNLVNELNSFHASASYVYDRTFSFTGGYFNIWGTPDAIFYQNVWSGGPSPNSRGFVGDIAFLPFSNGGPEFWPWLNVRVGVTYTHYDEFEGGKVHASQNDSTMLYTWFAF
jgi:hypothetical protein